MQTPCKHEKQEDLRDGQSSEMCSFFFSFRPKKSSSTWVCYVTHPFFFLTYFIYLFLAALGLCCCVWASHCGGFSCCRAQALGTRASVVVAHGFSCCGLRALERRLGSCGTRAQLLRGMWDHPGPGLQPLSPALAGGFLTIAPPGKSLIHC